MPPVFTDKMSSARKLPGQGRVPLADVTYNGQGKFYLKLDKDKNSSISGNGSMGSKLSSPALNGLHV